MAEELEQKEGKKSKSKAGAKKEKATKTSSKQKVDETKSVPYASCIQSN